MAGRTGQRRVQHLRHLGAATASSAPARGPPGRARRSAARCWAMSAAPLPRRWRPHAQAQTHVGELDAVRCNACVARDHGCPSARRSPPDWVLGQRLHRDVHALGCHALVDPGSKRRRRPRPAPQVLSSAVVTPRCPAGAHQASQVGELHRHRSRQPRARPASCAARSCPASAGRHPAGRTTLVSRCRQFLSAQSWASAPISRRCPGSAPRRRFSAAPGSRWQSPPSHSAPAHTANRLRAS